MPGYFGTEQQKILQARVNSAYAWIIDTPGACNPVRLLGTDDPDRLGWDVILEILARDGLFAFRMISAREAQRAAERLTPLGYRVDSWDVFVGSRASSLDAISAVLSRGLPAGFRGMPELKHAGDPDTLKFQMFVAANGIAPFSGSMLVGDFGPTTNVWISDGANEIAATAHGYFPHNRHSPHHRSAWGGLIAVSPDHRGKGLGTFVNARMVANCFEFLRAETVHEFVFPTNVASRKMVEASGLKLDPDLKCCVATANGDRFTR